MVAQSTVALVPDVVGDFAATAKGALVSAGFAVQQVSVVDDNCEAIGQVLSQTPSGGAVAPTGSTVVIRVGTRPKHPCP